MGRYAKDTTVSVERSKGEIERLVVRYGADSFASGWESGRATVGFRMNNKYVRFDLEVPDRKDFLMSNHDPPRRRSPGKVDQACEQATRSCWRSLALVIKAKLEAVETGITSFESEFLAHIMLPDGKTVGQHLIPQIETAYEEGTMPRLLPYGG